MFNATWGAKQLVNATPSPQFLADLLGFCCIRGRLLPKHPTRPHLKNPMRHDLTHGKRKDEHLPYLRKIIGSTPIGFNILGGYGAHFGCDLHV